MKSTTTSVNISMPARLKKVMQKRMAEGGFENASEYVRHLIREDSAAPALPTIRTREDLEREIRKGERSGKAVVVNDAFWARIRKNVQKRVERAHAERTRARRAS